MVKPPKEVRVLGRQYRIALTELDEGIAGLCHNGPALIEAHKGLAPIDLADTLVHEVFHAILWRQGREENAATEERFVRALATGLIAVLQDNPDFAKWLCSKHPDHLP